MRRARGGVGSGSGAGAGFAPGESSPGGTGSTRACAGREERTVARPSTRTAAKVCSAGRCTWAPTRRCHLAKSPRYVRPTLPAPMPPSGAPAAGPSSMQGTRGRGGGAVRGIAHRMAPRHVRGRVQILLERRRRPEDQQREERRARQGDAAAHGGERAPRTGPTGGGADVTAPFLMSATTPAPASVNVVSSEGTVSSVDRTPGRAASNPRRVGPRVRTTRTSATSRAMVTPTKTKSACVNQVRGGPAVLNTRSRGHPRRV